MADPFAMAAISALIAGLLSHKPITIKRLGESKQIWLDDSIPVIKSVCELNDIPYQVCVAQAALESGWGQYAYGNNLFGMKGSGDAGSNGAYAKYSSQDKSIQSYCDAIKNNQFWSWIPVKYDTNPQKYAIALWGSSYAPGKNYVPMLFSVMGTIYRATGNYEFNIKLSKDDRKLIDKISQVDMGSRRRELTRILLEK
jgi:flagellum-specific peptidoglycan hydrolase FlgJ